MSSTNDKPIADWRGVGYSLMYSGAWFVVLMLGLLLLVVVSYLLRWFSHGL